MHGILDDEHFESGKQVCREIDHDHMAPAPPCRTLTMARRSNEHGVAKMLRSNDYPEGWGEFEAVEASLVIARMVVLVLILHNQGGHVCHREPLDVIFVASAHYAESFQAQQCRIGAPSSVLLRGPQSQTNWSFDFGTVGENG